MGGQGGVTNDAALHSPDGPALDRDFCLTAILRRPLQRRVQKGLDLIHDRWLEIGTCPRFGQDIAPCGQVVQRHAVAGQSFVNTVEDVIEEDNNGVGTFPAGLADGVNETDL